MRLPLIVIIISLFCTVLSALGEDVDVPGTKYPLTSYDLRFYLDSAIYLGSDTSLDNGCDLRRARFAVKSEIAPRWDAELDLDAAAYDSKDGGKHLEFEDIFLQYSFSGQIALKLGQYKAPFGLETLTSSSLEPLMERPYAAVLGPGRRCGIGFSTWNGFYQASVQGFAQNLNDTDDGDESPGFTGRLTCTPLRDFGRVLHLGVSGGWISHTSDEAFSLDTQPEVRVDRTQFLDTGNLTGVHGMAIMDMEAGAVWNSLYLQGEYLRMQVDRDAPGNATFDGGYVMAGWYLTGHSRGYDEKAGEFTDPQSCCASLNAWELVARYSYLSLTDEDVLVYGGRAVNCTLGLNWHVNTHVKLMLDAIYVNNSHFADGEDDLTGNDDFVIVASRVLVRF